MSLKITGVHLRGKPHEEHVRLQATQACDLHDYIVADTSYAGAKASNKLRHMHWFDSYKVASGDWVFLYTGPGTPRSFKNEAGSTTHVFYWGLERTVWNNDGDQAILFGLKSIQRAVAKA